jgi:hypothetical protein
VADKLWPKVALTPDHKAFGGARQQSLDSDDAHNFLWAARVIHVDTEAMLCSIRLETGTGERHDVPLPASGGGGPRSWAGCILEPGSKVIIGWKKYSHRAFKPYIIGVMTVGTLGARNYEPFSTGDPTDVEAVLSLFPDLANDPHMNLNVLRLKSRKGYPGDFVASSSSGADLILDKDFYATNQPGNEIRLRASDQTYILQTSNEFVSNSAGYYRRGLIRRDAFNLQLDLLASAYYQQQIASPPSTQTFDQFLAANPFTTANATDSNGNPVLDALGNPVVAYSVIGKNGIPMGSPAYTNLLNLGLITPAGTQNFPDDPTDPFYPFVVHPDGQRASYVVTGEHSASFSQANDCYVEDRVEIRHTSDGTMAVTADGDGVQIDPIGYPQGFIEDVRGTVVGNDPYTDSGRALYKRILTMRVFDSPDDGYPSGGPKLEPIDTVVSQSDADTKALCRLFRVQSPTNSNQYAFGITKEGRVMLHVPASTGSTPDESGKSIDVNTQGVVKAILGMDQSRTSLDFTTQGGVKINLGTFITEDPSDNNGISVDLTLAGKVRTNYQGTDGRETVIGSNDFLSVGGTYMQVINGNSIEAVGGAKAIEGNSITLNAGPGGMKMKYAGDWNQTILGRASEMYALPRICVFAVGDIKTMLAGVDVQTVVAGGITRTVTSGAGIVDTVAVGNYVQTVGTGNFTTTVGTGNMTATVGTGNLVLTAGGGSMTMTSGIVANFVASAVASLTAPLCKVGPIGVGYAVAGAPGPPSPALDYITGLPLFGQPTVLVG